MEKCRRQGCERPKKKDREYCSKQCSPFGMIPLSRKGFKRLKKGPCGCLHVDPYSCAEIKLLRPLTPVTFTRKCECINCHAESLVKQLDAMIG